MRSPSLALSLLIGCSEYEINKIPTEEPAAASDSDVAGDEPETNEEDVDVEDPTDTATTEEPSEDEGLEPDGECGFHLQDGPLDEAFTQTYVTYELQTPETDLLSPGDTLELWYGITANPCGDAEVIVLQYAINDEANWETWLMPAFDNNEEAYMRDPSDEFVFDAAAANGSDLAKEISFTWSDGYWPLDYDNTGKMDTVLIEAGETKWFVYEFPHTELAPIDTIADTMLSTIIWRDVGTDQEVQGWNDGHTDIWTTVQFVE